MTYTVIKIHHKAWLKEDAVMTEPELKNFLSEQDGQHLYPAYNASLMLFNQHIASLRTIQIAPEYVDYWDEGAKVEEGDFKIMYKCAVFALGECDGSHKECDKCLIAVPAIPAQDEAGLWDEVEKLYQKFKDSSYTTFIEELKSKYEIKRKK